MLPATHPARAERAPALSGPVEPRLQEQAGTDRRFAELLAGSRGDEQPGEGARSPLAVSLAASSLSLDLELDGQGLAPEAARALAAVLRDAVRRRQREVELRLRPAELGGLRIRIALEGQCLVHLEASTSDPRVAERLLVGRQELERGLARWGLSLGRIAIRTIGPEPEPAAAGLEMQANRSAGSPELIDLSRRSFFEVVI